MSGCTEAGPVLFAVAALGARSDGWAALARVAFDAGMRSECAVSSSQLFGRALFYASHAPGEPMQGAGL